MRLAILAMGFLVLAIGLLVGMSSSAVAQDPIRCAPYRIDWNNGLNESLDQDALRALRLRITGQGLSEICDALLAEINRQLERAEAAARAARAPAPPRNPSPQPSPEQAGFDRVQANPSCEGWRGYIAVFGAVGSLGRRAAAERDRLCGIASSPVGPTPIPPPQPALAAEEVAWANAERSGSCDAFEGFLSLFPESRFSGLARAERDRLCPPPVTASMTQSNPTPPPQTVPASPEAVAVSSFRDCPECPEMIRIPGQSFAAGRFEVTRSQYAQFTLDTGRRENDCWAVNAVGLPSGYPVAAGHSSGPPESRDHPAVCVSWDDAQSYAQWLSRRTGQRYRLLTELEWEIVARGGAVAAYSWGEDQPVCDESADNGANFRGCTQRGTRPVGSFRPNAFGVFDVHGNVWEWVQDCYSANWCTRVVRGGSWNNNARGVGFGSRNFGGNDYRSNAFGFRLARDLEG
jgi:formylglycine-generating enzyme required for sulfatase activity